MQVPPAEIGDDETQLSFSAKSPFGATPEIVKAAPPMLVSVNVWPALTVVTAWMPNVIVAVGSPTVGPTPVPFSVIATGDTEKLPAMLSVPLRAPFAVGINVTLTVHVPLRAIDPAPAQLSVSAKSPAVVTLAMLHGPFPVFVNVTLCAALALPTANAANARLVGEAVTAGGCTVMLMLAWT
jgi:hypothetical protein